eukprot:48015-Chlamydomonas_euryale.AAC.1
MGIKGGWGVSTALHPTPACPQIPPRPTPHTPHRRVEQLDDAAQRAGLHIPGPIPTHPTLRTVGLSSLMMLRSEPDSTSERRPSGSRCMRLVRILAAASRRSPTPRKSSSAAAPPPPPPPSFDASRKSVAKSGSIARYGWRQHRSTRSIASALRGRGGGRGSGRGGGRGSGRG